MNSASIKGGVLDVTIGHSTSIHLTSNQHLPALVLLDLSLAKEVEHEPPTTHLALPAQAHRTQEAPAAQPYTRLDRYAARPCAVQALVCGQVAALDAFSERSQCAMA